MKGKIGVEDLCIECIIGVHQSERVAKQKLYVDLLVEADFSTSSLSDSIEDTICYVELCNICKELAETGRYRLLEALAADVLKILLERFPIYWAWIRIKKPSAIEAALCATVELECSRDRGY